MPHPGEGCLSGGAIETREASGGPGGLGVATGFRRPEVPGLAHLAACSVPTTGDGQAGAQQPSPHPPACPWRWQLWLLSPQWRCDPPGLCWWLMAGRCRPLGLASVHHAHEAPLNPVW